ncbi:MAG: hypothetical protein ABSF95_13240 [Verrucomicrobiota bacterium]
MVLCRLDTLKALSHYDAPVTTYLQRGKARQDVFLAALKPGQP